MTFKDVAVDITQEDWELMRPVQKELYKTVTLQNYWNMVSLGKHLLFLYLLKDRVKYKVHACHTCN